jgi:chromate transporter
MFLKNFSGNVYIQGAFEGIKAATVGLILVTAYSMGRQLLKGKLAYLIAAVAFIIIVVFGISAVWAIIFGGLSGFIAFCMNRRADHD